jgi:hypothetical protein
MMDMKRRPAFGCDFDDEIVEGPAGIFPRNLENEISAWTGLEFQSIARLQHPVSTLDHLSLLPCIFCKYDYTPYNKVLN